MERRVQSTTIFLICPILIFFPLFAMKTEADSTIYWTKMFVLVLLFRVEHCIMSAVVMATFALRGSKAERQRNSEGGWARAAAVDQLRAE